VNISSNNSIPFNSVQFSSQHLYLRAATSTEQIPNTKQHRDDFYKLFTAFLADILFVLQMADGKAEK
jgi:hypothetical protein